MPNYGTPQSGGLTALAPGESMYLFGSAAAGETPTAPQASIPFARVISASQSDQGTTFQIIFTASPTAVVEIQASNVDVPGDYVTVYTSTNTQFDAYTDVGRSAFYRARLLSGTGTLTVIAQR